MQGHLKPGQNILPLFEKYNVDLINQSALNFIPTNYFFGLIKKKK